MDEALHIRVNLPDKSYQAGARSEIKKIAEVAGFKGHRLGEVEIIIAEVTSNLWKHALKGGFLLVRIIKDPEPGIELISIDQGPGMSAPGMMVEDGSSTKKTLGHGLGAIRRLSNDFDLYSLTGWGTVLFIRAYLNKEFKEAFPAAFEVNVLSVCKTGQQVSGDSWKYIRSGRKIRLLMADGLGHGPAAYLAGQEAVNSFVVFPKKLPTEQIISLHNHLKKTRGIVVNVAYIDMINQQIMYSGVGNITMKLISPSQVKGCFSYNGIVGHIMPAIINNHMLPLQKNTVILMHTDGISARWDIQKYHAILQHHPMILCSALYKDFDRGNDDVTILMGRFF